VESSDGSHPELRPGYSPDRLAGQCYLGGVIAVRRRLWDAVLDRRSMKPMALSDHRRMTALGRAARAVAHIPRPLYRHSAIRTESRRRPEPFAADESSVSVIIPTNGTRRRVRGRDVCLVHQAVASIIDCRTRAGGASPAPELVVVTTPGIDDTVVAELRQLAAAHRDDRIASLRIVHDDRPFNFSNACNRGAVMAGGDVLVFLNDDTEVITADWLDRLVAWTSDPAVGAVGARLYYEDGTIQHNGLWTRGGHPAHRYEGREADGRGHLGSLTVAQNCLAVTGACLAVRAELFHRVGGFSPVFPSSYNDVDLCLKLLDHGHRTVIDPVIELFHFEASSRDPSISGEEMAVLHGRWRSVLNHDPFDNPNFDAPGSEEFPLPMVDGLALLHDHEVERPPIRVWPLESLATA
jgi:GT2 family glycosyltransferase